MSINDKYILDGQTPVVEPDLLKWAAWFEKFPNRVVAKTWVGSSEVSTVFLAFDHNFHGEGPPVLFETMIFHGARDGDQRRYCTYAEAQAGHAEWVAELKQGLTDG